MPQPAAATDQPDERKLPQLLSGWGDSNSRPPAPKAGALTKLRYTPYVGGQPIGPHHYHDRAQRPGPSPNSRWPARLKRTAPDADAPSMHSRLLIVAALMLAACSSPPDVVVSRADAPPATGAAPDQTIATAPAEPAVDPGDLTSLLLTDIELPEWNVSSSMAVGAEPTFVPKDCAPMRDVWSIAARPGERTRGDAGAEGVRFRNTAVAVDDADEAARLLTAVSTVWESCPLFTDEYSEWWTEPFETPGTEPGARPSEWNSAAIVLGNTDGSGDWAIAVWQRETTMVVLEVEGDDMWHHIDFMFEVMSAHLDQRQIPVLADEWSDITDLQDQAAPRPSDAPTPSPTASEPPVTPPADSTSMEPLPTSSPAETDAEFPPAWEDWSDHALASLAPHPDDLGEGWQYEYGSLTEAEPSSPDDEFPGCPGTAPPSMDGVEVTYRRDESDVASTFEIADEMQVLLGSGDAEAAQATLDALRRVFDCEDAINAAGAEVEVVETTVEMTADDTLVLTYRIEDSLQLDVEILSTIAVGRYGDLMIAVVWSTADPSAAGPPSAQEHADRAAALVEETAAAALTVATGRSHRPAQVATARFAPRSPTQRLHTALELVDVHQPTPGEAVEIGHRLQHVEVRPPEDRIVAVRHTGECMGEFVCAGSDRRLRAGDPDVDDGAVVGGTARDRGSGVGSHFTNGDVATRPPGRSHHRSHGLSDRVNADDRLEVGSVERRQFCRIHLGPLTVGVHRPPRSSGLRPARRVRPTSARSAAATPRAKPSGTTAEGAEADRTRPHDSSANTSTRSRHSSSANSVAFEPDAADAERSTSARVSASSSPIRVANPNRNARRWRCVAAPVERRISDMCAAAC